MSFFSKLAVVEEHCEFELERALWSPWLDFDNPKHRPEQRRLELDQTSFGLTRHENRKRPQNCIDVRKCA